MADTNISSGNTGAVPDANIPSANSSMNSMQGGVGGETFMSLAEMNAAITEAQKLEIQLQTLLNQDQAAIAKSANDGTTKSASLEVDQAYFAMGFAIAAGVLSIAAFFIPTIKQRTAESAAQDLEAPKTELNLEKVDPLSNEAVSGKIGKNEQDAFDEPAVDSNIGKKGDSPQDVADQKKAANKITDDAKETNQKAADKLREKALTEGQNLLTLANTLLQTLSSSGEKGSTAKYQEDIAAGRAAATTANQSSQTVQSLISMLVSSLQTLAAINDKMLQNYAGGVQTGSQHS